MIKVVLADDHSLVRDGIKALLEEAPNIHVTGEVSNGEEAIEKIRETQPDIAILDIRMPVMNGIEASRKIRKLFPKVKIMMLSMHDTEEYVIQSIESGASGYLLKDTNRIEFIKAINFIHQGEKYFSGSISHILIDKILNKSTNSENKEHVPEIPELTKREKQILSLIVEGHSNRKIATLLDKSIRTIETHRFNLMKKLKVKNVVELIKKAEQFHLIS